MISGGGGGEQSFTWLVHCSKQNFIDKMKENKTKIHSTICKCPPFKVLYSVVYAQELFLRK